MSPVLGVSTVMMPPTPLFPMHAGFQPAMMPQVFPPSLPSLASGIETYRRANGYEPNERFPYHIIGRLLEGERFEVGTRDFRIANVRLHQIAHPIAGYPIGDVEMHSRLLIAPIAAAVAAHPYLGKGWGTNTGAVKDEADGQATDAYRAAHNRRSIRGIIPGGEGGGRDGQSRKGALYMGERVGTQYGLPVQFLVDPLEVTNATKALDPEGAWGKVGHGWADKLRDPAQWYAGYSGASSLQLAIDGRQGGSRDLSDFLYLDKLQFSNHVARQLAAQGISLMIDPKELVNTVSAALRIPVAELRTGALARARHMTTFKGWIEEGVEPWNISTPSDGDAMFTPALASGALHFAGLTGGVMEGVISAALGIPLGIKTYLQFASNHRLGEHKENADLRNEEHRFGFSEKEYDQMLRTKLFDGKHIGHTLRKIQPGGEIESHIMNAAFAQFTDGIWSEEQYQAFLGRYQRISSGEANGERFTEEERAFLKDILTEKGFLDVRRVLRFSDIVTSRDWLAAVAAITPNKWAPLLGIREDNHKLVVETLVAGGSNAVYVLESEVEEI